MAKWRGNYNKRAQVILPHMRWAVMRIDITDPQSIEQAITQLKPTVIINASSLYGSR